MQGEQPEAWVLPCTRPRCSSPAVRGCAVGVKFLTLSGATGDTSNKMQPVQPAGIPNLILGAGPTAIAAAYAFRRLGVPFEVLDVAYDLEPAREAMVETLSASEPANWPRNYVETLFPAPVTSAQGVEKRLTFGSNFPYEQPQCISCSTTQCKIDLSHGLGGFGNVWGAAVLPYSDQDLGDWPISSADLADSYRNLSQFVPISAEFDRLEESFPLYHDKVTALTRSEQTATLLKFLNRRDPTLRNQGIAFGRARVAVDSSGGPATCRYCGYCLDGCSYGSIFNPRLLWKKLEQEGIKIHKGLYAIEFEEEADSVVLSTVNISDGSLRKLRAQRLFVGMGAISTTRLIARSIKIINKPVRILDSQYFFFPFLSYRKAKNSTARFTLAEIFLEMLRPGISDYYIHFQVYGLNDIFRQTIKSTVSSVLRNRVILSNIESRFYLFQGFLHSADSGHLELTVKSTQMSKDEIHVRGVANPVSMGIAKRSQALLRRNLAGFGVIPPFNLTMVALGRSFHAGGSFPMGKTNTIYSSDLLGRPSGLSRIHILDASSFPSIPSTTIAYTAMANADRAINETFRNGYL
jgi:ferredoxin